MPEKFYITTPIYYPNAEPHLGHCYTTLAADTLARYHRLAGHDTWFLTGTDEHGIKMVKTAADQKIEPQQLADRVVSIFQQVWKELEITNDDFIRTTEPRHKLAVQEIVKKLHANGDLYLGAYEGWYDEGQEEFVTETEAKAAEYKSVISGRPLVRYKEPTWFFRLAKYAARVLDHIERTPDFIQPETRRNEVISKLKAGVEDLSISRATLKWGIPLPHDPDHVVYVWIDALSNYITALGYPPNPNAHGTRSVGASSRFEKYWPVDVHLIGKEILWFHTVYWPAMLMSLGEALPKKVFAHGWWTAGGRKMSKTMGNFIDLEKLRGVIKTYGQDSLRFYLLRAAPFGHDLDWSDADLLKTFNELRNVLGNLLNRVLKMISNYRGAILPPITAPLEDIDRNLQTHIDNLPSALAQAYDKCDLQHCALLPIDLARLTNGYIDATAPFKLAKDPAQSARLDTILHLSAQAIHKSLLALLPILPHKSPEGLRQLNIDITNKTLPQLLSTPLPPGHKFHEGTPLFPQVV